MLQPEDGLLRFADGQSPVYVAALDGEGQLITAVADMQLLGRITPAALRPFEPAVQVRARVAVLASARPAASTIVDLRSSISPNTPPAARQSGGHGWQHGQAIAEPRGPAVRHVTACAVLGV